MSPKINMLKNLEETAKKAGDEIMKIYNSDFKVLKKENKTPVTEADIQANKVITKELKKTKIPILSEESKDNSERLNSKKVWIVDPMDGTRDFIKRTGEFCVMIGLVENGKPIAGVVYLPAIDKMYLAKKGEGAYMKEIGNRSNLRTSNFRDFSKFRMVVGRGRFGKRAKKLYDNLGIGSIKRTGSNGLKMGLISENKADIFYNPTDKMGEWDLCAPQIILEESGGRVTNSLGGKIVYNKENPSTPYGVLATNKKLHKKAIDQVKKNAES